MSSSPDDHPAGIHANNFPVGGFAVDGMPMLLAMTRSRLQRCGDNFEGE
jgi:hypothetical protein